MKTFAPLVLLSAFFLGGCGSSPAPVYSLVGSWKGLEKVNGKTATITFDAAGNYTFNNGTTSEKGTFGKVDQKVNFSPESGALFSCTFNIPVETTLTLDCPTDGFTFTKQPATR